MKKEILTSDSPEALGPYSKGIKTGNLLFTAQSGAYSDGSVDENFVKQAHQCMKNISSVINAANGNMNDVVKCTIYLKDINDFSEMNEIYASYFEKSYPSRICMAVSAFPGDPNTKIEIDVIASID